MKNKTMSGITKQLGKTNQVVLLVMLVLVILALFVVISLQFTSGDPLFDFTAFWIAGRLTLEGKDPYSPQDWIPVYEPYGLGLADNQTFLYPKPILPLLLPFGMLDLKTASILWLVLAQITVFTSAWLLAQNWPDKKPIILLSFLLSIMISRSYLVTLNLGQLGGFFLLILTASALLWREKHWFFGGLVFSLLVLKPSLGIPIVGLMSVWFLMRRKWRYFFGLAVGGTLMLISGWLFDPNWIMKFIEIGTGKVSATFGYHPTLWGLSGYLCGLEADCTFLWGTIASVLFIFYFGWLHFQHNVNLTAMTALGFAVSFSLLLTPYLWVYDQLLLILPIAASIGLLIEKDRNPLLLAMLPVFISLHSMVMLSVAERINNDVWSVLVPLLVLLVLSNAVFGRINKQQVTGEKNENP